MSSAWRRSLLASFFSWAGVASAAYSEAASRQYVLLNQAMGVSDSALLETWTCGASCNSAGKVSNVRVLSNSEADTFGVAGVYQGDCLLVFRGTKNQMNILLDLDIVQVAPYASCPSCKVHRGFLSAWRSLKTQAEAALQDLGCKGKGVRLSGHSLGGSISSLAAWDLIEQGYNVSEVYTYGEPRNGNTAWASAFQQRMANRAFYRIVHYKDPAPHYPSVLLDYHHAGPEVYYNTFVSGPYNLCAEGEDEQCSGQWALLECLPDSCLHCSYLGLDPCEPGAMQPQCDVRRLGADVLV